MHSRRDTVLLLVLIGVIVLLTTITGSDSAEGAGDPRTSSYHTGPMGARALYETLRELGLSVDRRVQPLDDAGGIAGPLVMLSPAQEPTPLELRALAEWVREGGTLIYAARRSDPTLDTLGLSLVTFAGDTLPRFARYGYEGQAATPGADPVAAPAGPVSGFRRAFAREGALAGGRGEVLMSSGGRPVVVRFPVGRGRVVAFSDPWPLVNERLKTSRGAVLFARVAADAAAGAEGGKVWFDEYHHGYSGNGSLVRGVGRFLAGEGAGRAVLQAGAVALLLLLLLGRRFGAPIPPPPARRRSPLEHVDALAGAYRQGNARRTARRLLLAGLARRLGRRPPPEGGEGEMLERLTHHASAGPAARALEGEWKKGQATDLVALSRDVDRLLEEVRKP